MKDRHEDITSGMTIFHEYEFAFDLTLASRNVNFANYIFVASLLFSDFVKSNVKYLTFMLI